MTESRVRAPFTERFPLYEMLLVMVALALAASFYLYLYAEKYDFIIEASCDPATQECYTRDCSGGDCPPNELSTYRVFRVPATTFDTCTDNGCTGVCTALNSPCLEIACSTQSAQSCAGPGVSRE